MSSQTTAGKRGRDAERVGAGVWLLVACVLPLIVFFALIALKVI